MSSRALVTISFFLFRCLATPPAVHAGDQGDPGNFGKLKAKEQGADLVITGTTEPLSVDVAAGGGGYSIVP